MKNSNHVLKLKLERQFLLLFTFLTPFLLFVDILFAQPATVVWDKTFGGNQLDILLEAIINSDGDFVLGGQSRSGQTGNKTTVNYGSSDYWIIKTDSNGNSVWEKNFGGNNEDLFRDIKQTSDGGYILAGSSKSSTSGNKTAANYGDHDYWIIKTDANGNIVWDKSYGETGTDLCHSIIQTSDGGYLAGGFSDSSAGTFKSQNNIAGSFDYWIIKIDANGNKQWDKTYGGNNTDRLENLISVQGGGYVLAGHSESGMTGDKSQPSQGNADHWLIKTDANGDKVWDKSFGGSDDDLLLPIISKGANLVFGGTSWSDQSGDKSEDSPGTAGHWLIKTNKNGKLLSENSYGGNGVDRLPEFISTQGSGYLLGGLSTSGISGDKTESNNGGSDIWLLKIKNNGDVDWDKTLGGNNTDAVRSIDEIKKDEYLIAGWSNSTASGDKTSSGFGSFDIWILKITL